MNNSSQKVVFFHVDVDSPDVLARFWALSENSNSTDCFYEKGMKRAIDLFREFEAPATFFCVGSEIEKRSSARFAVLQAHQAGHEIANHSYSHSFLAHQLSNEALRREIQLCSEIIKSVIGHCPVGFRAPGYAIGSRLMHLLRELSFKYDSSAFWTPAASIMKMYHRIRSNVSFPGSYGEVGFAVPRLPYFPSKENWKRQGEERGLLEIPLPRSPFFVTPFYNNFHLTAPNFYRVLDVEFSRNRYLVYLFHLIEFCDLNDGIASGLKIHPNLKTSVATKIDRMRDTIQRLKKKYRVIRTDNFAKNFPNQ